MVENEYGSLTEGIFCGTGRRKSSVAKVSIKSGKGEIVINNRKIQKFCSTENMIQYIEGPLLALKIRNCVDLNIKVSGGGTVGQSSAISHGISRALERMNLNFRPELKKIGYMKRDSRIKERKKPGRPGARKRFQFSKR